MTERKTAKKTATKKATATKPAPKRPAPRPSQRPAAATAPTAEKKGTAAPTATSAAREVLVGAEVCPRCGTEKFGPEERIRAEGRRTVRYTVLVCERGHTFAHAVPRPS